MAIDISGAKTPELNENQKLSGVEQTNAPQADSGQSSDAKEGTENRTETDSAEQPKTAVVTYVGNGIWTDSTKKKWRNGDEHQIPVELYNKRKDIKFMVGYGEMKVTFV